MFITTEQRERLIKAHELISSVKSELTYDHEEYGAVSTAQDALKRAIEYQQQ